MSEHLCQKDENCVLQSDHSGPCNHFVAVPAHAEPALKEGWLERQGENSKRTIEKLAEVFPAEYTCPRCGSNVSTHICMGEPVAGETKRWQLKLDGCDWTERARRTLAMLAEILDTTEYSFEREEDDDAICELSAVAKMLAAPSVAEETKGCRVDNGYIVHAGTCSLCIAATPIELSARGREDDSSESERQRPSKPHNEGSNPSGRSNPAPSVAVPEEGKQDWMLKAAQRIIRGLNNDMADDYSIPECWADKLRESIKAEYLERVK